MRRHSNADVVSRTRLTFKDHASQSGLCSICIMDGLCEIGLKAKTGKTIFPQPFGTAQFGAEKKLPNIEDIQILPELFGEGVEFKKVKTDVTIGGFDFSAPLSIAAMGSTKVASDLGKILSEGAARSGIGIVIGENVLATYGKSGLKARIEPFLENYTKKGAILVQGNANEIKAGVFETGIELGAMGIEIKLGQGAKQGLGGEIKFSSKEEAEKYRSMGYTVIENPDGTFERHASPGNLTENELRDIVIKYSDLEVPVWIKTGMGRGIVKLIDLLESINEECGGRISCLTVDGFGGGTGMSPWLIMNETSVPSAFLFRERKTASFDILLAGGYADGTDVAKAMMLGASGVAMGRPFLIAANAGNFHEPSVSGPDGIVNFVNALKEELQMVCASQRVSSVSELIGRRENLFPLSDEAAQCFGLERKL
ncbi:MAG: hypothetical protein GXO63_00415 [Candidatus Micrarchaeota archaeon]|nr:hypothetical protein [Candidatus Micrarchaeota archaeon]